MELKDLHESNGALSVIPIKKNGEGTLIAIHLEEGGELKKHKTAVPAVLVCTTGKVVYETIDGEREILFAGHFVNIPPDIEHLLIAEEAADLVLMK